MKLASSHVNSTIYKFAQLPGWTTSAPKYRSGERLRRTWMQHRRKHRVQLGLMEMPLALKAFGHKQKSWTKYNFDLIKGNYWIHLAYWTIICCSAHALPKCERNDGFKKKKSTWWNCCENKTRDPTHLFTWDRGFIFHSACYNYTSPMWRLESVQGFCQRHSHKRLTLNQQDGRHLS